MVNAMGAWQLRRLRSGSFTEAMGLSSEILCRVRSGGGEEEEFSWNGFALTSEQS